MAWKGELAFYICISILVLYGLRKNDTREMNERNNATIFNNTPGEGKLKVVMSALYGVRHNAMALTLELATPQLISSSLKTRELSTITIFSVPEKGFVEYRQPSLDVLRYHVAVGRLEIKDLRSSLPRGSEIDTLFYGHPLIVTTTDPQCPSINNMTITMPDIYVDQYVIVHGVESFFDPYKKDLYPSVVTESLEKSGRSDTR